MKIIGMLGAAAFGLATLAATPVSAQRWDGYRDGPGRHHGRDWRHHRDGRGYGYGRDWRGSRWHDGYRDYRGYRGYRGRPRVVCQWVRTYRGPVERCFRR